MRWIGMVDPIAGQEPVTTAATVPLEGVPLGRIGILDPGRPVVVEVP